MFDENEIKDPSPLILELANHFGYEQSNLLHQILDWLPLKDLHNFAQTSSRSRQIVGKFFKMNYSATRLRIDRNGYFVNNTEVNDISKFAENISISHNSILPVRYEQLKYNESIKQVHLRRIQLSVARVKYLETILSRAECVKIEYCSINADFYNNFLKFCSRLKCLHISNRLRSAWEQPEIMIGTRNDWLERKQPFLEHLELTHFNPFKMGELQTFFVQNPNVRSFAVSADLIWQNRNIFVSADIKLDKLAVYVESSDWTEGKQALLFKLLNELNERGFHRRLHLYTGPTYSDNIASLNALEKLFLKVYEIDRSLPALSTIKELGLNSAKFNKASLELLGSNLINLERICVTFALSLNVILPFIERSKKLQKIIFYNVYSPRDECIINLTSWNKKRAMLTGATKVTVYVEEDMYLATKAATIKTDLDFIEIKRASSYTWHNDFETLIYIA